MDIDPLPRLQQMGYHRRIVKEEVPERDELIRRARRAPWNYTEEVIARALALSETRVGEVARAGRKS